MTAVVNERVILDTNVFVAAGFNPHSASAQLLEEIRAGRLRLVWNEPTRRETEHILRQIPPLSWQAVAVLFRDHDCYFGATAPEAFRYISDPDDRKFAALAQATGVPIVTNDDHLLSVRADTDVEIVTPAEYRARRERS